MPDTSKLEKLNRELEKSEKKLREAITDEQVSLFLKLLFHKDSTRQLMEKVFAGNGNFQGEDAGRKRP